MKGFLRSQVLALLGLAAWAIACSSAQAQEQLIEFSAQHYHSDFDTQVTDATGDVKVAFGNKKISADQVKLNSKTGIVDAKGSVVFEQGAVKVFGDSVHIDMTSGFGTFYNGRVDVQDGVTIEGKELTRVDLDRYRVKNGKVSTCHDCPQSWSMAGSTLDIQIEGYAEIHHALFQISDTPVAYFPVVYFPVKTKRQSGFLIPQFMAAPEIGAGVFVPYYWAISDDSDATFQANSMTKGGNRMLVEYRRAPTERTYFSGLGSFGNINHMEGVPYTRYGYSLGQRWQISPQWSQRFRGELASDGKYTSHYEKEFSQTRLPALENEASLAWQNKNLFSFFSVEATKDNVPRDAGKFSPPPGNQRRGDIHKLPYGGFYVPSFSLWGPLLTDSHVEYANFVREGPITDPYSTAWIRTGERRTLVSRLAMPRTFEFLKWQPSAEFRGDAYRFHGLSTDSKSAYRARLLLEQKLDVEYWKVYQTGGTHITAIKHTMSPFLGWTFADNDKRSKHPFFDRADGPRFDLFDPEADISQVKLNTITEEQKLKPNHIATFGLSTRMIAKEGSEYSDLFGASLSRDYNFRLEQFGRVTASVNITYVGIKLTTSIAFEPKNGDKDYQNSASFENSRFLVGIFQNVSRLNNEITRDASGWNATIKRVGPFSINGMMIYEGLSDRVNEQAYNIEFFSPSKCWVFGFGARQVPNQLPGQEKWAYTPTFDITYKESVKKGFQ